MRTWKRLTLLTLCTLLLFSSAAPVFAAPDEIKIPPLREWPIIRGIVKLVQRIIKKEEAEPVEPGATVEPDLREIPIKTKEDIIALRDLEPNERVRITATDEALADIIDDAIPEDLKDKVVPTISFGKGNVIVTADVDQSILESIDLDVPISLDDGVFAEVTLALGASACQVTVDVEYAAINGFSIGLKKIAQEYIDSELPGRWPEEICVEYIVIETGKANVVGYRK